MGAGYAFGAAVHELGHSMKAADAKAYAKFESAVLGLAQSDAALEQIARQTAADYLSPDSPARAGLLDAQGNIDAAALNEEISLRLAQELVADPEKLVRAVERDRGLMETFLDFVRGLKNRIAIRLSGSERAMLDEAERTLVNLLRGEAGSVAGEKYSFVRATDAEQIARAQELEAQGENAKTIWSETHLTRDGGGAWVRKEMPEEWRITYRDLTFLISPMGFKHTGIFPEQAANWDYVTDLIRSAGREIRLLNLFAYTGGATVAAAKAGAFVCHVDASKGMVARARQNAALSGVAPDRIRYIVDDCFKFVARELRRGSRYDAVILDPPSYGRGPNGEKWLIGENLDGLVRLITQVLSDEPLFVILNSYTTGLSPSTCGFILDNNLTRRFGGRTESGELGLRLAENGFCLPCGAASRWERV